MKEIEQKPAAVGLFGTVLVWILIFLFFYFSAILFTPKQYKTIKIRLDSQRTESGKFRTEETEFENGQMKNENSQTSETAENVQNLENSDSATAAENSPTTENVPVIEKNENSAPMKENLPVKQVETKAELIKENSKSAQSQQKANVKKSEIKKTENKKSSQSPMQKKPIQPSENKNAQETIVQKSIDELLAEQQRPKTPQKKEFDWSQFDNIEGNSSSSNNVAKNTPNSVTKQNALSGSSASSADENASGAKAASSSNSKSVGNQKASSSTSSALEGVISAKRYSSSSGGVSSTVLANTGASQNGKISLEMADGSPRVLLEPAEPKIILSEEAAAKIDSTKRLTVSFIVTASGNVPVTSVKISPDILPSLVSMEIREQISKWRFQSASNDGQARFDYTIQKQ